jgi:hypothetical protein
LAGLHCACFFYDRVFHGAELQLVSRSQYRKEESMSTGAIVAIVVAVAVLLIVAIAAVTIRSRQRSRQLRDRFGPEYDRTLNQSGNRKSAERELAGRMDQRQDLDLRELSASDRDRYSQEWRRIQADFVDNPSRSLAESDALLTDVMRARGYPVKEFDRRADLLSVDHPQLVGHYRQAHAAQAGAARGEVPTEQVRQAFIAYRALFSELLNGPADRAQEVNQR